MARQENTTDLSHSPYRCTRCDTNLLMVEIPFKTFCVCENCGWYAPEGFEKVRLQIGGDESPQFLPLSAYYYEESAEGPSLRTFRRRYCNPYEKTERIRNFQQKFLNNQPSSQSPLGAPAPRRRGGNKPKPEREAARQLIHAVLQRHRDQVLARQIRIKDVAAELIKAGQNCWHADGWNGPAAMDLISQEMMALRNSR